MPDIPEHRMSDLEKQMVVLYALDKLGETTNLQLIDFFHQSDVIGYFDLQLTLYRLCDGGQAASEPLRGDYLYRLTEAGHQALAMFQKSLPASALRVIDEEAPLFKERFTAQKETPARIEHDEGQEYHAVMEINERKMNLLRLSLSLPTPELAARCCEKWGKNAQKIYDFIVETLSKEDDA